MELKILKRWLENFKRRCQISLLFDVSTVDLPLQITHDSDTEEFALLDGHLQRDDPSKPDYFLPLKIIYVGTNVENDEIERNFHAQPVHAFTIVSELLREVSKGASYSLLLHVNLCGCLWQRILGTSNSHAP